MCRENAHIPDMLCDPVARSFFYKVLFQSGGRHIGFDCIAIQASAGNRDCAIIYIGRKNRYLSWGFGM